MTPPETRPIAAPSRLPKRGFRCTLRHANMIATFGDARAMAVILTRAKARIIRRPGLTIAAVIRP